MSPFRPHRTDPILGGSADQPSAGAARESARPPFLANVAASTPWQLVAIFLLLGIAFCSLGWWAYTVVTANLRQQQHQELQAIADFKAAQIGDWLAERRWDAQAIVSNRFLRSDYRQWLTTGESGLRARLEAQLGAVRVDGNYLGIELLDEQGIRRLAVGSVRHDPDAMAPERLRRFNAARDPQLIDLDQDRVAGTIHLAYVLPIRDTAVAAPLGYLRLAIDPYHRLYPLIQSWPTPSASAETLLVRREGDEILFLNDLRHIPNTALNLRLPMQRDDLPAARAVRGEVGVFEGVDYRGIEVLSYLRAIPGTPWQMVTKVDRQEVFADINRTAWLMGLGVMTVIGYSGLLLWNFWRRQQLHARLDLEQGLARIASLAPGVLYSFQLTPDGTRSFPYASPGIEALFGFSPAQLAQDSRPMRDCIHPEDLSHMDRLIAESARTGMPWRQEFRYTPPGKGEIWLEGQSAPERQADGRIVWHGYFSDITARKTAEFALTGSNRRYANLFHHMLEGFALCRMRYEADVPVDFLYLDVNPAFEQLSGLKDVVGKWVSEIIPGLRESNPELLECYGRVARTGQPEKLETYVPTLGVWFSLAVFCPGPEHFVAVFDNITGRKQAENALHHRNEELEALMEAVPMPIFLAHDPDCRTITGNRAANELFAVPAGANIALSAPTAHRPFRVSEAENGRELSPDELPMQQAARRGHPVSNVELCLHLSHDQEAWLLGNAVPLFDAAGAVRGAVGAFVDITARKAAQRNLEAQKDRLTDEVAVRTAELLAANQELQAFTYAASHDLKAPLRGITSFIGLLERGYRDRLEGDGQMFLDYIRKNATKMAVLIDDLLAHAQLEKQALDIQPVDLPSALRAILGEREQEIQQQRAEIRLDMPPLKVRADPPGLFQALRNLLENALKYSSRQATPMIEIGAAQEAHCCRLWIRDNGIGFDMTYHDRIFEIFRRLHTYEEYPGSGIGLALVKKAIERMGGKVWADSTPGRGAVFFLELPSA